MLADLLLALLDRLEGRRAVFVDQTDNVARLAAYRRRTADIYATDPEAFRWRFERGLSVQFLLRARIRRNGKVVPLQTLTLRRRA